MSDESSVVTPTQLAIAGGTLLIIGSFLPWVNAGPVTRAGISSADGIATLILGGGVAGYAFFRRFNGWVTGIIGAFGVVVGAYDIINPLSVAMLGVEIDPSFRSPGVGIYLTLIGGLVLLGAALLGYREGSDADG